MHSTSAANNRVKPANSMKRIFRPALLPAMSLLVFSLLITLVALLQVNNSGVRGGEWPLYVSLAAISWIAVYAAASYASYRTVYLFSNAYLLALLVFHLSIPIMLAFGMGEESISLKGESVRWMGVASWFLILALGSYGIGASMSLLSQRSVIGLASGSDPIAITSKIFLRWQAYGLLLASLVFFVLAIGSYGNLLDYKRQELYASSADSRGLKVFMMIFPGAALALALAAINKKQKLIGYGLFAFSVVLFMLTGYRSAALFSSLVGAVIWVKSGHKIPTGIAVASVVFVLISISVIGIFRQMGSYGELGLSELQESYEQSSIDKSFLEMGQALGVAGHVFRLVPAEDGHIYGSSYLKAIREMVPNVGFNVDSSDSRAGLGSRLKRGENVVAQMAPSDWLTYKIKRDQFDKGGGVGFSTLAEPYFNFGIGGVVVFFMVLGYLLMRFDKVDLLYNKYAFVFAACMLWPLMRTVRNDFSNFLKPLGFVIIILILWNIGLKLIGIRNNKKLKVATP